MSNKPKQQSVTLQACCQDALVKIEDKKEVGKALHAFLGASPFALTVLVNYDSNDWDVWCEAMKAVPAIVKERCRTIAQLELIRHPGGDLNKFWTGINDGLK